MSALVRKHASGGAISSESEHGGVGFFHAAAVIAATERGNNARMADQGRERGWLRRRRRENSHFWSRFVVLDLLALSAE